MNTKGFTLIELLIVISVLGILATGILTLINPLEQLAKARDARRIATIASVGSALEAYAAAHGENVPTLPANPADPGDWVTQLYNAREVPSSTTGVIPVGPAGVTNCNYNHQNGMCVHNLPVFGIGPVMIVWTVLESKASKNKAGCGTTNPTMPTAIAIWNGYYGKAGVACNPNAVDPPFFNYPIF